MTADHGIVCQRCGYANAPGDAFCGSCGAFLEWEGEPGDRAQPGQPQPGQAPAEPGVGRDPDVPIVGGVGGTQSVAMASGAGGTSDPRASVPTEPPTPSRQAAGDPGLLRCPACGIANAATRTFCQSCGTRLLEAPRIGAATPDQIAAAVNAPNRPARVPAAAVRSVGDKPARPPAGGAGVGRWIVILVVVGLLVGAGAVGVGTLLHGGGPVSGVTSAPVAAGSAEPSSEALATESPGASASGAVASPAGPTPKPTVAPKPVALKLLTATASSVVGDLARFQPTRAIDGDPKTCWQEGSKTEKGQWIEVRFAPSKVTSLFIVNGYNASKASYRGNLRLKDITVSIDGGPPIPARLRDTGVSQKVSLKDVSNATSVRITIVSTWPSVKTSIAGSPFDDAALGEIVVNGIAGS